jgi:hypothetical protein
MKPHTDRGRKNPNMARTRTDAKAAAVAAWHPVVTIEPITGLPLVKCSAAVLLRAGVHPSLVPKGGLTFQMEAIPG